MAVTEEDVAVEEDVVIGPESVDSALGGNAELDPAKDADVAEVTVEEGAVFWAAAADSAG